MQCEIYGLQCEIYNIQCAVGNVQFSVINLQCSLQCSAVKRCGECDQLGTDHIGSLGGNDAELAGGVTAVISVAILAVCWGNTWRTPMPMSEKLLVGLGIFEYMTTGHL